MTASPAPQILAIIPAAGHSRRMRQPKQLIPIAGRPMLLTILEPLAAAEISGIALVTHKSIADQLEPLLENLRSPTIDPKTDDRATSAPDSKLQTPNSKLSAPPSVASSLRRFVASSLFLVPNENPATEMIDSIRLALHAWQSRQPIQATDGFLICPADHPGLTTPDFNACIAAFRADPTRIIIASHNNHPGHPIIFPASLAPYVYSESCNTGLNALRHNYPHLVTLINRPNPATTRDLDTPEDLKRLTGK